MGRVSGGVGVVRVQSGSSLTVNNTMFSTYLGFAAGASGSLTVDGTGSTATLTKGLVVGNNGGTGTLVISNGAKVSGGVAAIAYSTDSNVSTGTATVSGVGSTWASSQHLAVGSSGVGSLTISDGGLVTDATGYLGYAAGATGTATVTGQGSTWASTGLMCVGYGGAGILQVMDGGSVRSNGARIGDSNVGTVNIQGAGSNWVSTGASLQDAWTYVGLSDSGQLAVSDGGLFSGSGLWLGVNAAGSGTMTVDGQGSMLQMESSAMIGRDGTGALTVSDGGTATTGLAGIGVNSGSFGSVLLTGAGSRWDVAGDLFLGGILDNVVNGTSGGTAILTLADGAVLSTAGGLITPLNGSAYESTSTVYLGAASGSSATLNIGAAAGNAAATPGTLAVDNVVFGPGVGTINFNHTATDYLFSPAISGAGTINALAGTTILTGDSSGFSGSTAIASGATLRVDHGGALGGNVTNSGGIVFNPSGVASYADSISGMGTLDMAGSGTLNLTGDSSSFTGATTVLAGELKINGSLSGSAVTVASGGSLSGAGVVGDLVTQSGATVTPGNSPGTLTVSGNYTALTGSTYAAEFVPSSAISDRIDVSGTATIQNGAVLQALKYGSGVILPGVRYTILTAAGGVTGTYTLAEGGAVSAFYSLRDSYDANAVYLDVAQTRSLSDAAQTRNQRATASGLTSLPIGSILRGTIGTLPDDESARAAFDHLSGEVHPSVTGALVSNTSLSRMAVLERIGAAFSDRPQPGTTCIGGIRPLVGCPVMWMQGLGARGRNGGDGNAQAADHETGGFLAGVDAPVFDNGRFGLFAGYQRTTLDGARSASSVIETPVFGVYGGAQWGNLALRAGASYGWNDIATSRAASYPGYTDRLSGKYAAGTAQAFGEVDYRIGLPAAGLFQTAALHPFAGLSGILVRTDGFSEEGQAAALIGRAEDTSVLLSSLGVRVTSDFTLAGFETSATATLGWRHAMGDTTPKTTMAFAGSDDFVIHGTPLDRETVFGGIGLSARVASNAALSVAYSGEAGRRTRTQAIRGSIGWRF
ncbi:autotransporter domain-containing protein [Shinella zoogloeoides]|uniref:autotransporter domain-containing protein n=1 Tax=Shinella zoogloeoides TaxID=352475 RepID=UPI001E4DAC13|nr:autotransporter domain-containing protein [Shinella zoogloeoides]UEX82252.1 autotransporter domain-containing protein [Shinella zoogloeoides]